MRAVAGQVVSVKQACVMLARGGGTRPAAAPNPWAAAALRPDAATAALPAGGAAACGVPPAKARAIRAIAAEVAQGRLLLEPPAEPEQTVARLCALPGVGDWTAQYVAMRALGWPDAFSATDYALRKVLEADGVRRPCASPPGGRPGAPMPPSTCGAAGDESKP